MRTAISEFGGAVATSDVEGRDRFWLTSEKTAPSMSTVRLRDAIPALDRRLDTLQAANTPAHTEPSSGSVNHTASQPPELGHQLRDRFLAAINPAQAALLSEQELRLQLQRIADEWTRQDPDSVDHHEFETRFHHEAGMRY